MFSEKEIYQIVNQVTDPEIPVLSISDIGILRQIEQVDGIWEITITPTYSGCPAMHAIETSVRLALSSNGVKHFRIITQLSPAWTTAWMTDEAKAKLEKYGIAPPNPSRQDRPVKCPQCESTDVEEVSRFGSTACKALWKCRSCLEPFDYFKCH